MTIVAQSLKHFVTTWCIFCKLCMYRCISMWNTNAFPSALHGILMKNVGQVSFCTLAFDGMPFISEALFFSRNTHWVFKCLIYQCGCTLTKKIALLNILHPVQRRAGTSSLRLRLSLVLNKLVYYLFFWKSLFCKTISCLSSKQG